MDEQTLQAASAALVQLKLAAAFLSVAIGVVGVFLYDDRSRLRQLENEALRKSDIESLVAQAMVKYIELQADIRHG